MGVPMMGIGQMGMRMAKRFVGMNVGMGQSGRNHFWMIMKVVAVIVSVTMIMCDGLMPVVMFMLFTEQKKHRQTHKGECREKKCSGSFAKQHK